VGGGGGVLQWGRRKVLTRDPVHTDPDYDEYAIGSVRSERGAVGVVCSVLLLDCSTDKTDVQTFWSGILAFCTLIPGLCLLHTFYTHSLPLLPRPSAHPSQRTPSVPRASIAMIVERIWGTLLLWASRVLLRLHAPRHALKWTPTSSISTSV
jgi:hypothetical protein